jgi:hypothetical protein
VETGASNAEGSDRFPSRLFAVALRSSHRGRVATSSGCAVRPLGSPRLENKRSSTLQSPDSEISTARMMTCGSNNACELLHTLKKIFAGCFGKFAPRSLRNF